jgi:hypothetical protein
MVVQNWVEMAVVCGTGVVMAAGLVYFALANRRLKKAAQKYRRLRAKSRGRAATRAQDLRSDGDRWRTRCTEAERALAVHKESAESNSAALTQALADKNEYWNALTSERDAHAESRKRNTGLQEENGKLRKDFNEQREKFGDLTRKSTSDADMKSFYKKELYRFRGKYRALGISFAEARNDRELARLARQAASEIEHLSSEWDKPDPTKR